MVSRRVFASVVLATGVAPAVALCVVNGFVPALHDLSDPLGRPSTLSLQINDSARRLDAVSARLEPKHAQLAADVQVLGPVSNELGVLTSTSERLSPLSVALTGSTAKILQVTAPLPGALAGLTARAGQAGSTVTELSGSVDSITTELQSIHGGLTTIQATLEMLGTEVSGISSTLADIQQESAHVREFGPLLAVVGPLVNSLDLPPSGIQAPPLPPLPKS